jgi:predicted transporter
MPHAAAERRIEAKGGTDMSLERFAPWVRPAIVVAGVALFADLFLGWREVSISVPALNMDVSSNAWNSTYGIAAGMLVLGLLLSEVPRLRDSSPGGDASRAGFVAVLAAATFGFTAAAFAAAEVSFNGPMATVAVGARLWPAYAAVVLASLILSLAVAQLLLAARAGGRRWPSHTGKVAAGH